MSRLRIAAGLCIAGWACAPGVRVRVRVPAEAGAIAAGTRWETRVVARESRAAGPTVLVIGGMHGDERAGWEAAEQVASWEIARGRLLVVPRANRIGVERGTRHLPWGRDLNRAFPRNASDPSRGELASSIWELVRSEKPAWILDLHEAKEPADLRHPHSERTSGALGESVLWAAGGGDASEAERMAIAVAGAASDDRSRFVTLPMGIPTMLTQSAAAHLGARALLLETWRKRPLEVRREQHLRGVRAALESLGMLHVPRGASARHE